MDSNDQITPEQARQVLQAEQQKRLEECQRDIDAVLKKHNCALSVHIEITPDGRIAPSIVVAVNAQ